MTSRLTSSTVAGVMTREPVAVAPGTSFKATLELLDERRIGAVPVVSATGRAVGEVSEEDLPRDRAARRGGTGRLTAEELMTSPAPTAPPDTPLAVAAKLLADSGRRHYAVDGGRLVGVLAAGDVQSPFLRPDKEIRADLTAPDSLLARVDGGIVPRTGQVPYGVDGEAVIAGAIGGPGVLGVLGVRCRLIRLGEDRRARRRRTR